MYTPSEDLLTLDEFMDTLQIGRSTAYSLLSSGELFAFKLGKRWKIPRAAVAEYISRKSKLDFYNKK